MPIGRHLSECRQGATENPDARHEDHLLTKWTAYCRQFCDRTDFFPERGVTTVRVFVAGASGAIGRPLIAALVAARHDVIGMTSKQEGVKVLRERGAEGVVLNALDAEAVTAETARIRPDVIIDELTSLPKSYTGEEMRKAAPRDRQIRLVGGGNLQTAALKAGVKRYIVQSTGFFYGPGEGLASEEDPLAHEASPGVASAVATYTQVENRVLRGSGMEGVALRYGFFYGPGTYHDPRTGSVSEQARQQQYPVIDPATGVFSFVHVEDAAAATGVDPRFETAS